MVDVKTAGRGSGTFTGDKLSTINLDMKKYNYSIIVPNAHQLDKLEVSTRMFAAPKTVKREMKDVLLDAGNIYVRNVNKKFNQPRSMGVNWKPNIKPLTAYKTKLGGSAKIMRFRGTMVESFRIVTKESDKEVAVFVGIPKSLAYPNGKKVVDVARRQETGYIIPIGADRGKDSSKIRKFFLAAMGVKLKKGKRFLRIKPGRPFREPALKVTIKEVNEKFKNAQILIAGKLFPV